VISRARHHDEAALEALYERAFPVIYRYVLARLGQPELVEDVVAEVFLVMLESIGTLRAEHEAGFFAWLIQIAHGKSARALRHYQRSKGRLVPLEEQDEPAFEEEDALIEPVTPDLTSDPAAIQEWRETLEELGLALSCLTTEQQIVVIGRFLAGQRIEDLARALKKQPGAVRALQFRALTTLAERLGLVGTARQRGKGGRP
jgi:RNA polymerase sigma-70 factor (ECF subfamily)